MPICASFFEITHQPNISEVCIVANITPLNIELCVLNSNRLYQARQHEKPQDIMQKGERQD